jgi:hypothetical protein
MKMRKLLAPAALLALLPLAATAQEIDMALMQKWAAADVIRYHIVGAYQDTTYVASDGSGQADVTDAVVIDLTWKLSEAALVGTPTFKNSKSIAQKLRDRSPTCLAPVLKGEYEHYELLSVKQGLAGALEFTIRTTYPVVEVAQMCMASRKAVPAKVNTDQEQFSLPNPTMFAMPIPNTPELSITPNKTAFIMKKHGWTWTITPTK